MWVTKLMISQVKKRIFCPRTTKFGPNFGIFGQFGPGHAGVFDVLLVGWLVVEARGLYLARHLFTLIHRRMFDIFLYSVEKANHGFNFASKSIFFILTHQSGVGASSCMYARELRVQLKRNSSS